MKKFGLLFMILALALSLAASPAAQEGKVYWGKDTPAGRAIERRPSPTEKVIALKRCGGLHHRYVWQNTA